MKFPETQSIGDIVGILIRRSILYASIFIIYGYTHFPSVFIILNQEKKSIKMETNESTYVKIDMATRGVATLSHRADSVSVLSLMWKKWNTFYHNAREPATYLLNKYVSTSIKH